MSVLLFGGCPCKGEPQNQILLQLDFGRSVTVLVDGFGKAAKLLNGCGGVGTLFLSLLMFGGSPYKGEPQNAILLELHFGRGCHCVGRWL